MDFILNATRALIALATDAHIAALRLSVSVKRVALRAAERRTDTARRGVKAAAAVVDTARAHEALMWQAEGEAFQSFRDTEIYARHEADKLGRALYPQVAA